MANPAEREDYFLQIRDKLRKDDIKLWLAPYYIETKGPSPIEMQKLSTLFATTLNISEETCQQILYELQTNSLENLKQKTRYQESGLATVKIKILDHNPRIVIKELLLSLQGSDLKAVLATELNIPNDRLKLICVGKVLNETDSLSSQGVRNGQMILAIVLTETAQDVASKENNIKELENTKTDSRLLALDNEYMQLEDQFGNAIKIPSNEKKAIIVAMALHEKGRAAIKKDEFSRALVFLLEADEEFKQCNSQILNSVDNYALLELDIAWCYLCLQSFNHLPEAQERLRRCEDKFHKTYGSDMARLIAVKGTTGNEAGLLMRLHLLQAVVLYHQNKRTEALKLFKQVENELQRLKVDENSILALVDLGYTLGEARIGLRATGGDVNYAANYINENRQKRLESRRKAKAEAVLEKEKKKLGLCDDGTQYVDPNFLTILINMGFNKEAARIALIKCNNIISDSVQYIQENPLPGPSQSISQEFLLMIEEMVPQLIEAGFDPRMSKIALQKHDGDILKAVEELLANNGIVLGDLSQYNVRAESIEEIAKKKTKREKDEAKEEAFQRLAEDISIEDDNHLDLNLVQEEMFLGQYLSLLEK